MTSAIPIIHDDEMSRLQRGNEESGFGCLRTERGTLPLTAMNVDTRIAALAYTLTLEQTFKSALSEPMEATYIFPLPDRAGVTRFRMEVNGRVIEGDIKERGEARREYDTAIRAGHRAAITEEERSGVFTMRVGNLMPGEQAKVILELTGPLVFDDGEATFRFPLVVAPRYIPGNALGGENVGDGTQVDTDAVPDASRISPPVLLPGFPNPVRLGIEVSIDGAGLPISDLRSSLHAITEEPPNGRGARRLRVQPGERLNRDFILRFRVPSKDVRTALHLVPDANGAEGTFMLTLVPPDASAASDKARDVVFVLDRSGSMDGWKMVAARRAVARMVDTLRAKDNFAVYAFDDQIETAHGSEALVPATDRNRFRAVEMLAKLASRGGTEMLQPLTTAAATLAGGYQDRDRVIVLATDGQVGNEDQILHLLGNQLKNVRVFSLGIDRAVNEGFLKRLAALGGGLSELVESEDRLDEVMEKIHRRIATPVLSEVKFAAVGAGLELAPGSIAPSRIPDLFAGAPISISGRYRGQAERGARLSITGSDALGRGWSEEVSGSVIADRSVTTIWARAHVRDLEDRFVVGRGDKKALEKQIVETSVRFSVLSRFTAFVAVDRAQTVNPGGNLAKVTQPVEAPEGWDMLNATFSGIASTGGRGGGGQGASMPAKGGMFGGRAMSISAAAPMNMPASPASAADDSGFDAMEMEAGLFEDKRASKKRPSGPSGAPPPPPSMAMKRPPAPSPAKIAAPERMRRERAKDEAPAMSLAPYRARAAAMLDRLRQSATRDRANAVLAVAVELRALLEDLRSVGAEPSAYAELEILFAALVSMSPAPAAAELDALMERAESALAAFAGAISATGSRREFWK